MAKRLHVAALVIAVLHILPHLGLAQHGDKLGVVDFPTSCSPAVQEQIRRGVALLHSFYYSSAERVFEQVGAQDASCVIAAWGYASALMLNPLQGVGPSAESARLAQAAIDKARKMTASKQNIRTTTKRRSSRRSTSPQHKPPRSRRMPRT